mmetsp:Transcript_10618/g.32721  ORF Transcript_10618/g.32721 Transcript_10618/m.32721 type:complete len:211 (-) Transcript_10618:654-1286(-)
MAQKPEARHVRARDAAVLSQHRRRGAVGPAHALQRPPHVPRGRERAHVAREDRAGPQRFRENERVALLEPALREIARRRRAVHRQTQSELRALARVAAHELAARRVQRDARARHHLRQRVLDLAAAAVRHHTQRQRRGRRCAHGVAVRQRVVRRDAPEDEGVRHERPEKIHRVDDGDLGRLPVRHDGAVVGRVDAHEHVAALLGEGRRFR